MYLYSNDNTIQNVMSFMLCLDEERKKKEKRKEKKKNRK